MTVALLRVVDVRPEGPHIGVKKNGYGMDSAEVVLDDGVEAAAWVRSALLEDLRSEGFEVVVWSDAPGDAVLIHVELEQFFVEPENHFMTVELHAIVVFRLTVELPGGEAYARRFKGHRSSPFMLVTDGDIEPLVEVAAAEAVAAAGREICTLLAGARP
jgi:hypothetical protein